MPLVSDCAVTPFFAQSYVGITTSQLRPFPFSAPFWLRVMSGHGDHLCAGGWVLSSIALRCPWPYSQQ